MYSCAIWLLAPWAGFGAVIHESALPAVTASTLCRSSVRGMVSPGSVRPPVFLSHYFIAAPFGKLVLIVALTTTVLPGSGMNGPPPVKSLRHVATPFTSATGEFENQ